MTTLSLTLFGSFQAALDSKPITRFESNKVRALLAYLAVEADRPHSRDELIGLLWPDFSDATARTNLRQALSNLRLALNDRDPQPVFISTISDSIQFLRSSDHTLDVKMFEALIAGCKQHAHRRLTTCRSCMGRLQQAVELYRSDFLAHFMQSSSDAFEEWVLVRRERWHQAALEALYHLAQHYELRGDFEQMLQYARRQIGLEPWREEAHRQAMRALALSGQRSAALAQFEMCRRLLQKELNAEPARETTALAEQVKVGALAPAQRSHNLPAPLTPMVGRERELAEIAQLLENPACRLLTLTGPGGIGKTRLALAAAVEQVGAFTHGVYFVPLAPLNSADYLVPAIAQAIGFTFFGLQVPQVQLLSYLREKEMLLVLDNLEHLSAGVGLLTDILQQAPGLTLVATSRERLNLQGEWIFDTQGLNFPPGETVLAAQANEYSALELFALSVGRVRTGFSLSDSETACAVRLCRLVSGMPLAIELAAGWMRTLSCDEITSQIEQGFSFLTTSLHDVPERHRSIQAVFDHSWNLLSEEERCVFRRLSVFRGGFTRQAAERVTGASLPLLTALVDKSLVRRAASDGNSGRYDLHELLRQYAHERLAESGEAEQIQARHLEYFVTLAEEVEPKLEYVDEVVWLNRLESDHDNLRAALSWVSNRPATEVALGLRLAGALSDFWHIRGHWLEACLWFEGLLEKRNSAPVEVQAKALLKAMPLLRFQKGFEQVVRLGQESLALYHETQDRRGMANVFFSLGFMLQAQRDYLQAAALFESSLKLSQELNNPVSGAYAFYGMGRNASFQGDLDWAVRLFEQGLAMCRKEGRKTRVALMLSEQLGGTALGQENYERAAELFYESLALMRELDDKNGVASVLNDLGILAHAQGDYKRAAVFFDESMLLARRLGNKWLIGSVLTSQGCLAMNQDDPQRARMIFEECLIVSREIDDLDYIACCLTGLAGVAGAERQYEKAARLFGAGEALLQAIGGRWSSGERAQHERDLTVVRHQLDEATFAAAWVEGSALTPEQAIGYALAADDDSH